MTLAAPTLIAAVPQPFPVRFGLGFEPDPSYPRDLITEAGLGYRLENRRRGAPTLWYSIAVLGSTEY